MIYFIVIFSFLLPIISVSIIRKKDSYIYLFNCIVIISIYSVIFGLRGVHTVGDSLNYMRLFSGIDSISSLEIGFKYFIEIFRNFTDNFVFFNFFISSITISIVFYSYYVIFGKYSIYTMSSLIFLFSLFSTFDLMSNTIRQGLAISIFSLGMVLVVEKENRVGYLFCLLSVFFHSSTIILLLIFISVKTFRLLYINKLFLLGIVSVFILLAFFKISFFSQIKEILPSSSNEYISFLINKILSYGGRDNKYGSLFELNIIGFFVKVLPFYIPIVLYSILFKKYNYKSDIYYYILCFSSLCYLVVSDFAYSFRFIYITQTLIPIVLIFCFFKLKKNVFAYMIFTYIMCIVISLYVIWLSPNGLSMNNEFLIYS